MSKMSDLDAALRAAGIDPEGVDLETVQAYREAYDMTHPDELGLTFIEAAREKYKPKDPILVIGPEAVASEPDLPYPGVEYVGQQKRGGGAFSLDLFTDLKTGTSFLRLPLESLKEALERARGPFKIK